MNYLIDTQILIWLMIDTNKIPYYIYNILKDLNNNVHISLASIWEIVIKSSINKLVLPFDILQLTSEIEEMNIEILSIDIDHILNIHKLPLHHKDPFDRLIISQSIIEKLPIVTSDNSFKKYEIEILW